MDFEAFQEYVMECELLVLLVRRCPLIVLTVSLAFQSLLCGLEAEDA